MKKKTCWLFKIAFTIMITFALGSAAFAQQVQVPRSKPDVSTGKSSESEPGIPPHGLVPTAPFDASFDAQTPRKVPITRPEQQKNKADAPEKFLPQNAEPSSSAFKHQPDEGKVLGFDFYRDPLNSKKPMMTFEQIRDADIAERPKVSRMQRDLLEQRYNLRPQLSKDVFMTRGKPLAIGPTAKLPNGMTWEKLAEMTPEEIRSKGVFPYLSLPHPKQTTGGQVFPRMQILMFPRLERFDVEFDIPDVFLPEFPAAIFLSNRPEMGDVSRGEVVSINNFYALFKHLLTPVQLDGLRMLLTPFPQEEFNPTDDRKSLYPSLGVTCLDCHINGQHYGTIPPES